MRSHKFSKQPGEQYVIPILAAVIFVLVVIALFSDDHYSNSTELETTMRKIENGQVVNSDWFSVEVSQLDRRTAREYNIPSGTKGVVITEIDGAGDVRMKLRKGDVISGINGERIKSVRDFRTASRNFDPEAGVFLDINRNGSQMFVPISGDRYVSNSRSQPNQTVQRYRLTEPAPFLNRSIDPGGFPMPDGVIGKGIESWVNQHIGGKYFTCMNCGTLVPQNRNHRDKTIYCPNCHKKMILK